MSTATYYAYTGHHCLDANRVINQASTTVQYPFSIDGTKYKNPVFHDTAFLKIYCDKNSSDTFTIKNSGCGICCVAMFILNKTNVECNNANVFKAVEFATKKATNEKAWLCNSTNFEVELGGKSATVHMEFIGSDLERAKESVLEGKKCIIGMKNVSNENHYVLADGFNENACEMLDWFLVCDSNGGKQRTLREAVKQCRGHSVETDTFTYRVIY